MRPRITVTDTETILGLWVISEDKARLVTGAVYGVLVPPLRGDIAPTFIDNPAHDNRGVFVAFSDRTTAQLHVGQLVDVADINDVEQQMVATDRSLGWTIGAGIGLLTDTILVTAGALTVPHLDALTDSFNAIVALIGIPFLTAVITGDLFRATRATRFLRPRLRSAADAHANYLRHDVLL